MLNSKAEGSWEQVYLDHLGTIEKAAAHAGRRFGLSPEDVKDFTQEVSAKICADGYAVLQKHEGRSKLATYLVVVVQHAIQDFANHKWGKWRPSEEAKRHGPLGVQLERLLVRDRLSFSEAVQMLKTNYGVTASEAEIARIAEKLPARLPRRMDGWSEGPGAALGRFGGAPRSGEAAAPESADERLWREETARQKQKVYQALTAALKSLPDEEAVIAGCMLDGLPVVKIAHRLHIDQKRLYKQRERILKKLRRAMERAGIHARDVAEILDRADT